MDRFKRLVVSFYREELQAQLLLSPLKFTKFNMNRGKIYIQCLNIQSFQDMQKLMVCVAQPFYLLKIGREIILQPPFGSQKSYNIELLCHRDLLA